MPNRNLTWIVTSTEAWIGLPECRLVILKNILDPGYGWRWVLIPYTRDGGLDIEHPIQSAEMNSEIEPYPTQEGAMEAVQNFYQRRFTQIVN